MTTKPTPAIIIAPNIEYIVSDRAREIKLISRNGNSTEKKLAQGILNRDPLRYVISKEAFADAQTGDVDPEYSQIAFLRDSKNELTKDASIDPDLVFFDEPWKDLPFENRYHPYSDKDKSIKIERGGRATDIALDKSSLAFYIAKVMA